VAGIAFSYPRLNAAAWLLLGLALIGSAAIAIAVRAVLRQHRAYRHFLAQVEVVGRLGERAGVQVIAERRPQAFCAGYLRPTVYISQGAAPTPARPARRRPPNRRAVRISAERVDSLLGHPVVWRRPRWLLTASLGSLMGLITLTWGASRWHRRRPLSTSPSSRRNPAWRC